MDENPCSDPSLQQGYYAPTGKEVGPSTPTENRYEGIELILKSRTDGESWFDYLFDLLTVDCEGDPESEENTCTCGLEHMSGSGGTYDEVMAWTTTVGHKLQPIDLARAIIHLTKHNFNSLGTHEEQIAADCVIKAIKWAHKEIEFEEYFENREWENEEENEDEQGQRSA